MSIFGIRHKNKRSSAFCSKRTAFCVLFLVGLVAGITAFVLKANAQLVPVASVEIFSEHTSFANNEPGAWKVTKSAKWTAIGEAQVRFEFTPIEKSKSATYHDVLLVIDNSGSMDGSKMDQVIADASDLAESLLSDENNRIALVTFESRAAILSGFTNNKSSLINMISDITVANGTNYYDGLLKAETLLDDYVPDSEHDLTLLFLTDGFPNEETPNEIAEYHILKEKHPYMEIAGIQYEMGNEILQPIIDVSDYQYIANMSSLGNVLFEAVDRTYHYENLEITDYINDTYWHMDSVEEAISASFGSASLSYDGTTPIVTWDLSKLSSKTPATLIINIKLNDDFLDDEDLLLPTNYHETITSSMDDVPDENIDSLLTPVLRDKYDVIYLDNSPSDCDAVGILPATTSHTIFSVVEISDSKLTCQGYIFKGWSLDVYGMERINDNYFRMPSRDVHAVAVWGKPSVVKSMDGEVKQRESAIFDTGQTINAKMKQLSGDTSAKYSTENSSITAFVRSEKLSSSVDFNDDIFVLSSSDSPLPIYGWFDNGVIYYYSDAIRLSLNPSSRYLFYKFTALSDISGLTGISTDSVTDLYYAFGTTSALTDISVLSNWNTKNVTTLTGLFNGASSITNLDALSTWNTSSVTSLAYTFANMTSLQNVNGLSTWNTRLVTNIRNIFDSARSLTDISGLSNWNTSSVTLMQRIFNSATSIENVNALSSWRTSKVTNLSGAFAGTSSLTNLTGLSNWSTYNVTDMSYTFSGAKSITNIDALSGWGMSRVTTMNCMFSGTSSLTNIDGASSWLLTSIKILDQMFGNSGITNIDGALNWNVYNARSMKWMFVDAKKLTNINGALNWNTTNVTDMSSMFSGATALNDISGAQNWRTQNVTTTEYMFLNAISLTNVDALANWNVSNLKNAGAMFKWASHINSLEGLRNWRPARATEVSWMFDGLSLVTDLSPLEDWVLPSSSSTTGMFNSIPSSVARPSWYHE